MARYDVYFMSGDVGFLLDCQADIHWRLQSRFVVPLWPRSLAPPLLPGLTPVFTINDEAVVMMIQSASAVPVSVLTRPVASLIEQEYVISNALDMLLTGY